MKKLVIFVGALTIGFGALAQTTNVTSPDSANHVTIIVNQNPAKKIAAKKVITAKKIAVKKTLAKRPTKIIAVKPIPKAKTINTSAVAYGMYNPNSRVPGKRVTLANPNAARANSYTTAEQTMAVPMMPMTSSSAPALTTKIKQETKVSTPSPWGLTVISYNAQDMNAIENANSKPDYTVRAWERFYISYNFNPDISLALNPQFNHTWFQDQNRAQSSSNPGLRQSYAANLMDTGLILKDTKLADLTNGFILGGFQSYYAPTGEPAQTAGELGETRTNLSIAKSIGKLDLKWQEEFRYYLQQFETNAYLDDKGKPLPNVNYRLLNLLDAGYNFTKELSLTLETGFINEAKYADSYNNTPAGFTDYFELNPELDYSLTKNFTLALGIYEVYNTTNQPTTATGNVARYSPFAPENGTTPGSWTASEAYLQGTLKF